ncbi:MAG: VWA domain-containing protein [Candidatus Omnitrophica bacterium]|nr:VWA domain-containing protein [Candidatus Omnitrophota bacterium]
MVFKTPWILAFIPAVLWGMYIFRKHRETGSIRFSSNQLVESLPVSWKIRFQLIPLVLRAVVLVLVIVALAGPRLVLKETMQHSEGIDIILAIDSSGSMASEDFTVGNERYNRLDIVKKVVNEFVEHRPDDRIGIVTFAALAYTVCPLTTDHAWLAANLQRVRLGMIADGTAIGSAIASSLNRLRNSKAKSKIIILLTDGVNNAGEIDPLPAAQAAKAVGIKVYAIGAGTKGYVPFPVQDFLGRKVYQRVLSDLDETILQKIADVTRGKYFRATDTESLRKIYETIDKLEKTEIQQVGYLQYDELFDRVLLVALAMLLAELILSNTVFLKIP